MNKITGISDTASQQFNLNLPDGSVASATLSFRPQQTGWFLNLAWNGQNPPLAINGLRVVESPNFLRQFRSQIPFGIGCVTSDGQEPIDQAAFSSGRAALLLLDQADVGNVEAQLFPGA